MELELTGSHPVAASVGEVRAALRDPGVLAAALPGDAKVAVTGPGAATVTVTTGLAGTRGTYRARLHVVERAEDRWRLRVAAAGETGTLEADVEVALTPAGDGCRIEHRASLVVEGRLAGLGRRVLEGAGEAAAGAFADDLGGAIGGAPGEVAGDADAGAADADVAGAAGAVDAVDAPGSTSPSDTARSTGRIAALAAVAAGLAIAGRWVRRRGRGHDA